MRLMKGGRRPLFLSLVFFATAMMRINYSKLEAAVGRTLFSFSGVNNMGEDSTLLICQLNTHLQPSFPPFTLLRP